MIRSFEGKTPKTGDAAFLAASAVVLGDVTLGPNASVWYGAVLRGDAGAITVGEGANIQDCAVLHCDEGGHVTVGKNVTVGHSAIVHGCEVGEGTLVGMHATLLNHCRVGKNCIIGAGALVPEGMEIPDGMLALGVPARLVRPVSDEQRRYAAENAAYYVAEARRHAAEETV